MIYQGIGDGRSSLGEYVTDSGFLASLPPALFWLPVALLPTCCSRIRVQPWGWHVNIKAWCEDTYSQD